MAPASCFGGLKNSWRGIFRPGLQERELQQQQQEHRFAAPQSALTVVPINEHGLDLKAASSIPHVACHPATTLLLGSAEAQHNSVPIVSPAALNGSLFRVSDRIAVVSVSTPPPTACTSVLWKGKEGPPLQSWCSALHISGGLQLLLNTLSLADYMDFIQALVETSSPGLQDALLQCGQRAWQAKADHDLLTRDGQQLDGTLTVTVPIQDLEFGLTLFLTPMLIKGCSAAHQPAVFIEHLVEHHEATLEQQLRYKDMLLSRAPAILTICDLQGNVLHQNAASIQYAGHRTPLLARASLAKPAYNYLQQALQHEPEMLQQLLDEIDKGRGWSAAGVKVPATLESETAAYGCLSHPSVHSVLAGFDFSGTTEATSGSVQASNNQPARALKGAKSWNQPVLEPSVGTLAAMAPVPSTMGAPQVPPTLHSLAAQSWSSAVTSPAAQPPEQPPSPAGNLHRQQCRTAQASEPLVQNPMMLARSNSSFAAYSGQFATLQDVSGRSGRLYLAKPASSVSGNSGQFEPFQSGRSSGVGPAGTSPGFKPSRLNMLMRSSVTPPPDGGSHEHSSGGADFFPASSNHIAWQDLLTMENWTSKQDGLLPERELLDAHADSRNDSTGLVNQKSARAVLMPPRPATEHASHEPPTSWHEIKAWPTVDPSTGATLVVISQVDVTERMKSDTRMTQVSDACVSLLELIFPRHVIEHLAVNSSLHSPVDTGASKLGTGSLGSNLAAGAALDQLATKHECVTLFFCDIVGFTTMSKEVEPVQIMQFLNSLYSAYDQLVDEFGVYKVETVGDCYVVAGGLMTQDEEGFACVDREGRNDGTSHALAVYRFAQAVLRVAASTPMPHNGQPVQIRIGLHSGPITSGIIGHRMPKFCLFGDSMNTCSRMETTAPYGSIHLSQATYQLLAEQQSTDGLVCTGGVDVKGKGRMITYVYTPEEPSTHVPQFPLAGSGQLLAVGVLCLLPEHGPLVENESAERESDACKPARRRQILYNGDVTGAPNPTPLQTTSDMDKKRPSTSSSFMLQSLCNAALQPGYQPCDEGSSKPELLPLTKTTRPPPFPYVKAPGSSQGGPPVVGPGSSPGGPWARGPYSSQGGPPAVGPGSSPGGPWGRGPRSSQGGPPAVGPGSSPGGPAVRGPRSNQGGSPAPGQCRSASPTSNLMRVVSTLHQQQVLAHKRSVQTSEPIWGSSAGPRSGSNGDLRSSRTSLLLDPGRLSTFLSNLQLAGQPSSSSNSSTRLSSSRLSQYRWRAPVTFWTWGPAEQGMFTGQGAQCINSGVNDGVHGGVGRGLDSGVHNGVPVHKQRGMQWGTPVYGARCAC